MASNIVASTLPLLLSLLFFFIFSFPHPSHCTFLTCKDAVIQYWKLKFSGDKPPPPFFLAKLSTLSPLELAAHFANANITMAPKDDNHSSLKVIVDPLGAGGPPGRRGGGGGRPFLLHDRSSNEIDGGGRPGGGGGRPFLLHDRSSNEIDGGGRPGGGGGRPFLLHDRSSNEIDGGGRRGGGGGRPFLLHDRSSKEIDGGGGRRGGGGGRPFLLYNDYHSLKDKRDAAATGDTDSASDNNIRVDEAKERAEGMNVDSSIDSSPSTSLSSMFFMEKDLKKGATLLLPDFGSKYPPLTFLPRSIASNIPLSASAIREMFNIPRGTRWDKGIVENIGLCEGAPNKSETKRCVASAEDMIDLVVQLLGTNATARTTESYNGAGGKILIGDVKAVNDGKLGTSLACHQTLLPYLVHLCHTLPNSRVYEFEILDVETRKKINSGAAVCHVHVSGSEADHGLGEDPVCHWIFKWDMIWSTIFQY